jgi:hypothetical protein
VDAKSAFDALCLIISHLKIIIQVDGCQQPLPEDCLLAHLGETCSGEADDGRELGSDEDAVRALLLCLLAVVGCFDWSHGCSAVTGIYLNTLRSPPWPDCDATVRDRQMGVTNVRYVTLVT